MASPGSTVEKAGSAGGGNRDHRPSRRRRFDNTTLVGRNHRNDEREQSSGEHLSKGDLSRASQRETAQAVSLPVAPPEPDAPPPVEYTRRRLKTPAPLDGGGVQVGRGAGGLQSKGRGLGSEARDPYIGGSNLGAPGLGGSRGAGAGG
ncbi:unnamed protein product, partial [Discosporangium mesarthrocarpum]